MATKSEMFKDAKKAGLVPEDATADAYTSEELFGLLNPAGVPVFDGSLSAAEPQVAPDGHINLSKEDIDARAG